MQHQTTADGRRKNWTIEPCVYGRLNSDGSTSYMAAVRVGPTRKQCMFTKDLEEAIHYRDLFREQARELKRRKRENKALGRRPVYSGDPVIYFIRFGVDGPVKVGRTKSDLVARRLGNLQIASPVELQLLGTLAPGSSTIEHQLHRKLAHLRVRGEWFQATPEFWSIVNGVHLWVRRARFSGVLGRIDVPCEADPQ